MTAFMDGKMYVIEQCQLAPMERQIHEQQRVKDDPRKKLRSGDRFPLKFRKAHQSMDTTCRARFSRQTRLQALLWSGLALPKALPRITLITLIYTDKKSSIR